MVSLGGASDAMKKIADDAQAQMIPIVSSMIGDGKKILDPLTESAVVYRDHLRKAESAVRRNALKLERNLKSLEKIGAQVDTANMSVDICQKLTTMASDLVPQDVMTKVTAGAPEAFGSLQKNLDQIGSALEEGLTDSMKSTLGGLGSGSLMDAAKGLVESGAGGLQGIMSQLGGMAAGAAGALGNVTEGLSGAMGPLATLGASMQDTVMGMASGVMPKGVTSGSLTPEQAIQTVIGQMNVADKGQVAQLLTKTGLAGEWLANE